jgi:membrane carboxypeptidase/penicillin-binding protein PbpC
MLAANRGRESMGAHEVLAPPPGIEQVTICALSGMRANAWCPSRAAEWASAGDEAIPCSWHHRSDDGLLTVYPAEFRSWSAGSAGRSGTISTAAPVPPPAHRSLGEGGRLRSSEGGPLNRDDGRTPSFTITNPPPGAIYSVDPTLRREYQALALRAVTERPTTVTWLVDGATIGTASSERSLSWPLAIGAHDIEARDTAGRRAKTSVVVK